MIKYDILKDKYPDAMKLFLEWIDNYKQENHWDTVFRGTYFQPSYKFHEIPIAMQLGVLLEFMEEGGYFRAIIHTQENIILFFEDCIFTIQNKCDQKKL